MRELLHKFEPSDIIAFTIVLGCFALIMAHRDGIVTNVLTMITGYYFGQKTALKLVKAEKEST